MEEKRKSRSQDVGTTRNRMRTETDAVQRRHKTVRVKTASKLTEQKKKDPVKGTESKSQSEKNVRADKEKLKAPVKVEAQETTASVLKDTATGLKSSEAMKFEALSVNSARKAKKQKREAKNPDREDDSESVGNERLLNKRAKDTAAKVGNIADFTLSKKKGKSQKGDKIKKSKSAEATLQTTEKTKRGFAFATLKGTATKGAKTATSAAVPAVSPKMMAIVKLRDFIAGKLIGNGVENLSSFEKTLYVAGALLGAVAVIGVLIAAVPLVMLSTTGVVGGAADEITDVGKIYPSQSGEYCCPIPGEYYHIISSPFNTYREYTYNGVQYSGIHYGTDIAARAGTPVIATTDGVVTVPPFMEDGYGNYVILDAGNGLLFYYGHLLGIDVETGDEVVKGQVIGYVGSTGKSTGPHLHFEVRNVLLGDRRAEQNIDPITVLGIDIENHTDE